MSLYLNLNAQLCDINFKGKVPRTAISTLETTEGGDRNTGLKLKHLTVRHVLPLPGGEVLAKSFAFLG